MSQLSLLGVGGAASPPPPTVLLLDHFTDADNTSLNAHTMDVGAGWTDLEDQWSIQTDRAETDINSQSFTVATAEANHADATSEATFNVTSDTDVALVARHSDDANYYIAYCRGTLAEFSIYEVNGGSATQRATTSSFTPTSGVDFLVQIIASGAILAAMVNGANQISYGSATFNQTATRWGLFCNEPGTAHYDDFEVTL